MFLRFAWPLVLIVSTLAIVLDPIVLTPVRPFLTIWFLTVCPGMALVRLLDIEDSGNQWALATMLSLTLVTLVALVMAYTTTWSAALGLNILAGICFLGVVSAFPRLLN